MLARQSSYRPFRWPHLSAEIPPPPGGAVVPTAPVLAGTAGDAQVTLSWNTPNNGGTPLTSYTLKRNGVTFQTISPPSVNTYINTGLINGTTYNFTMTAENALGSSPLSNTVSLTPAAAPPVVPTITSISPASGVTTGGTTVTITGTHFTGATVVKFGTVSATNYQVVSDTSLTVVAPAGTGVVDITVTAPGGTTAVVAADQFTYTVVSTGGPTLPTNSLVGTAAYKLLNYSQPMGYFSQNLCDDIVTRDGFQGWLADLGNTYSPGFGGGNSNDIYDGSAIGKGSPYSYQAAYEGALVSGINVQANCGPFINKRAHPERLVFMHWLCRQYGLGPGTPQVPMGDWWDDAYWTNAANWFGKMGRVMKNILQGDGITFDLEGGSWDGFTSTTAVPGFPVGSVHDNASTLIKVESRGYQVGSQYWQNFPDGWMGVYDWRPPRSWFNWVSGWYSLGDTRPWPVTGKMAWIMGWIRAMGDYGGTGARCVMLDAGFYKLGEQGMTDTTNQGGSRAAKMKSTLEGVCSTLSQGGPTGMLQFNPNTWNKVSDRFYWNAFSWAGADGSGTPIMSPAQWTLMMQVDNEWSMGGTRAVFDHGDGTLGTGGGPQMADPNHGSASGYVSGVGAGSYEPNMINAAVQTPYTAHGVPTVTNLSWTGTTIACQASHYYGVRYVRVYNGQTFSATSPESSYLGSMNMDWTHPSLPHYVGTPGGSTSGWFTLAKVADSYQNCTFTANGNINDWMVLKVASAKDDITWTKVQRTA
jgi:hypothetical protein